MRSRVALVAALATALLGAAAADAPIPILPEAIRWTSPPGNPALRGG